MNKWYRSGVVKGILVFTAVLSTVGMLVGAAVLSVLWSNGNGEILQNRSKQYRDSSGLESLMSQASMSVLSGIRMKNNFETEGVYDPDKLVDILEYWKSGEISGKNESGIAYRLEDLLKWGEKNNGQQEYYSGYSTNSEPDIVVCRKTDGSYQYYYYTEFRKLAETGELQLNVPGYSEGEVLNDLYNNYSSYDDIQVYSGDGELLYTGFWGFYESFEEKFSPDGAQDILEVVNKTPSLNGELSNIYTALGSILSSINIENNWYKSNQEWEEGNTNFTYLYADLAHKKVYTNRKEYQDFSQYKENLKKIQDAKQNKYLIVEPKLSEFKTNMDAEAGEWKEMIEGHSISNAGQFVFAAAVDTDFPIQDVFYQDAKLYSQYAPYATAALAGSILCGVWFLICLIWLTAVAGRNRMDEEIHLHAFDRWKTELGAGVIIIVWLISVLAIGSISVDFLRNTTSYVTPGTGAENSFYMVRYDISPADLSVAAAFTGYTACMFLAGYLSLVRRIKARTFWKNSLLRSICKFAVTVWRNRSVIFRAVLALGAFVCIHWLEIMVQSGVLAIIVLALDVAALYIIVVDSIAKNHIEKGIKRIAQGDLKYQIPMEHLKAGNRQMAEMINDIGSGMQKAVEESVKSERLKTDLITNVSHDIKTPLTSIINYVDLLKREKLEDPKIQNYIEILEAKAQRLKTLTEDVVEASKVSSGNIKLDMMDVNLVEMVNQTAGEFEEKFAGKNLKLIQKLPDEPAVIHVDGRRMWRVLENLYNNAAKYSMPGTRVYADLKLHETEVEFSLKNISEYPLNISADELTERFIRGDISRSTEGSGLGLSIAKSLVAMQGGRLNLYLDGDLFKATVIFKRSGCETEEKEGQS